MAAMRNWFWGPPWPCYPHKVDSIQEECDAIAGPSVEQLVITGPGTSGAPMFIHAVEPRMGEGNADEKLRLAT